MRDRTASAWRFGFRPRKPIEGPCILTVSADVWFATSRFHCALQPSQATRRAGQFNGERVCALGGQPVKTRPFGRQRRLKRYTFQARVRAHDRRQRGFRCGYPANETTRGTVYFEGESRCPIGRRADPGVDSRPSRSSETHFHGRSADSHSCGYPSLQATRSAVVFDGEGAYVAGRRSRPERGKLALRPLEAPWLSTVRARPRPAGRTRSGGGQLPSKPLEAPWFSTVRVCTRPDGRAGSGGGQLPPQRLEAL